MLFTIVATLSLWLGVNTVSLLVLAGCTISDRRRDRRRERAIRRDAASVVAEAEILTRQHASQN